MDIIRIVSFFQILLAVCFQIYLVLAHKPYRTSYIRTTSFDTVIQGYALQNHVIKAVHEPRPLDCGLACLQTEHCQSYNARQKTVDVYECELSNSTKTRHSDDYKAVSEVTYYGSDAFTGLGCTAVDCPNCVETKSHPFYRCPEPSSKSDYDLYFPGQDTDYYVSYLGLPPLSKFTISWWLKTSWTPSAGTHVQMPILSTYHNTANDVMNVAILSTPDLELRFTIELPATGKENRLHKLPPINYNSWHHVIITWDNTYGKYDFYLDGVHRSSMDNVQTGQVVPGDCAMVIGQEQDSFGGGFSRSQTLQGNLSGLNIWDNVLPLDTIVALSRVSQYDSGNVVSWADIRDHLTGKLKANAPSTVISNDQSKSDYDLYFPGQDIDYYVSYLGLPSFSKFTISWWLQTTWVPSPPTHFDLPILSMHHKTAKDVIYVAIESTFGLRFKMRIGGISKRLYQLQPINDDRWHHMTITWDNDGGKYKFYLDGVQRFSTERVRNGEVVPSDCVMVIGQEQDSFGGSFNPAQTLQGNLSRLNIWDNVLPLDTIVAFSRFPGYDSGNVVSWADLRDHLTGKLKANTPSSVVSNDESKSGYDLHFPGRDTDYYVSYLGLPSFSKFTMSWWLKTSWTPSAHTHYIMPIISIYHETARDVIYVAIKSTFELLFNTMLPATGLTTSLYKLPPINDDSWHHMTITWDNADGKYDFYLDGMHRSSVNNTQTGQVIPKDCTLVIGQDQDSFGGGFSSSQTFQGSLSRLHIWDNVLPLDTTVAISRFPDYYWGNVVAWRDLRDHLKRKLKANEPSTVVRYDPSKSDYDLHFPGQDTDYYVSYLGLPSLSKFTISWWLKTSWIPSAATQPVVMSILSTYHNTANDVIFVAIQPTLELRFEIALPTGIENRLHKLPPINDNSWHHMLITWDNTDGKYDFYLDGVHRSSMDNVQTGQVVPGDCVMVIGQEQDSFGGGFSSSQTLQGSLSRLNIWDNVLSLETIVALARFPGYYWGNLVAWRDLQDHLTGKMKANKPSTVMSSVGKSNVALTFSQMSRLNHAVLPTYTGPEIAQLTVCTWIDFIFSGSSPCLMSYATPSTYNSFYLELFQSDLILRFDNKEHRFEIDSALHNKKWRHFCVTMDGVNGEANVYMEGNNVASTTSFQKGHSLPSPGIWAFTNDQDSYGGGFQDTQSIMNALAQTNVWNYVLPTEAIVGMSFGGTSVEGNLLRWSDLVTNYNADGYFSSSTFFLYLPDAVVQKKRDDYCNTLVKRACSQPGSLIYARVGPHNQNVETGIQWRCYCSENVGQDKNVESLISGEYSTRQVKLLTIV